MIGSSRSCRSRIRPSRTPRTIPESEPEMKPTSTRTMLIDTSAKISPLMSIGMAVRMTSSGGGIRNGLKMKVDSSCQIKQAISNDAADNKTARYRPLPSLRVSPPLEPGAHLFCGERTVCFLVAPGNDKSERPSIDMHLSARHLVELICSGDIRREQRLNFMKQQSYLRVGEIAWACEIDVEHLGDGGAWPGRHHADAIGQENRLRNIVGHEDHRLARAFPYFEHHRM